jgi:hypothetical protein
MFFQTDLDHRKSNQHSKSYSSKKLPTPQKQLPIPKKLPTHKKLQRQKSYQSTKNYSAKKVTNTLISSRSRRYFCLFVFEKNWLLRNVGALPHFDNLPADADTVENGADLEKDKTLAKAMDKLKLTE